MSLVQSALLHLDKGRHAAGLRQFAQCLRLLTAPVAALPAAATVSGGDGGDGGGCSRMADVSFCARYHVALSLLVQLGSLGEVGGVEAVEERARLSSLLAALPLLPHHRRAAIATAIRHNLRARNFGARPAASRAPPVLVGIRVR